VPHVAVKLEKVVVIGVKDFEENPTHFPLWEAQKERDGTLDSQRIKAIRLDKLLVEAGFVDSRTEADRKIKARAVRVMNKVIPVSIVSTLSIYETRTLIPVSFSNDETVSGAI